MGWLLVLMCFQECFTVLLHHLTCFSGLSVDTLKDSSSCGLLPFFQKGALIPLVLKKGDRLDRKNLTIRG